MTKHSWFQEYCEKTTSQCMQYFVMRKRSLIEKTFWTLAFILMLFLTTTAMNSLIDTWINNPTIMFIENEESSIQDIPFPTITVCPSNQLRKSVWEKYKNTNTTYWEDMQHYRSLLCSLPFFSKELDGITSEYLDYKTIKNAINLKNFMISCQEIFQSTVKWQNTTIKNICNLAQPLIAYYGICYSINTIPWNQLFKDKQFQGYRSYFSNLITFNYTRTSKWNLDYGYSKDELLNVYPLRSSGVSYNNLLRLKLHTLNDDFLPCPNRRFKDGYFLVYFSNPFGYPSIQSRSFILPDSYTKIQISPIMKKMDINLERRSPDVRRCYLFNEKKLSLFSIYTEENCLRECVVNETISTCGCISFPWIHLLGNEVKVCGLKKKTCLLSTLANIYLPGKLEVCNCLPTCTELRYDITESSILNDWSYLKNTSLKKNNYNVATVDIVFKYPYFTAYKAKSILDIYSFISVVGGTFGLFLGLNVLNIFEMFYVSLQMFIYYFILIFEKFH